jgi:integrase
MGRNSLIGGVTPIGHRGIRFDLRIEGRRYRPTLRWIPNGANLRRARILLTRIRAQIETGTFRFADEFPQYRGLKKLPDNLRAHSCGDVFDHFLEHEDARVARGDLAPVTVASHRQILGHVWRPHFQHLPFLGVRYSTLVGIADAYTGNKKTYNNAISGLRRAFNFGYLDYPERVDPAASLRCARIVSIPRTRDH